MLGRNVKQGREIGNAQGKLESEPSPGEGEEVSCVDSGEKMFAIQENSKCKGPEAGVCVTSLRSSGEAGVAGAE